ncbi:MAG: hypothetical protein K2M43_03475 [Mycoplasmoidaceae bacterium]|nr:hypothetical protein [Mycoplasmoidaceae bacterium]
MQSKPIDTYSDTITIHVMDEQIESISINDIHQTSYTAPIRSASGQITKGSFVEALTTSFTPSTVINKDVI